MLPATSSPAPAGSGRGPFLNKQAALLLFALATQGLPGLAWGDKGHRAVSALALRALPPEPRAWYEGREHLVADHASDPDFWRQDAKEGPRHFMDLEPYGDLSALPRTLEAARQKVGGDFYRLGVVPWIIQDRWRDLIEAFRSGDGNRVALATAILGHYVADAHVPLHTTRNHDGQHTNQRGVHSRWETGLLERYLRPEGLETAPARPDTTFLERPWAWLLEAHALIPQLLEDDHAADRTTPLSDRGRQRGTAYWMIFWSRQGPVVKQQLERAGQHLGDAILNAWIAAGKPAPSR